MGNTVYDGSLARNAWKKLKAMPAKLKVYGKKGGAVVSDAFGKLADSPLKKDRTGYQSLESAEALVSTDAAVSGEDRRRRAPLQSKGSNARFAKRETGEAKAEERSPLNELSERVSTELLEERGDGDRLRHDQLERSTAISEELETGKLGTRTESGSSLARISTENDDDVAELQGLLRNTELESSASTLDRSATDTPEENTDSTGFLPNTQFDSSARIMNRTATDGPEETTDSTGFPARRGFSRFTRGLGAASRGQPESSRISQHGDFEADKTNDRQHEQSRKPRKRLDKERCNESDEELLLRRPESTLSDTKTESEASTASWAASSLGRRAGTPDGNVLEIYAGQGTSARPREVTYLSKENGTMKTTRAPLRAPVSEVSYLSTENGTMRTRRGPVRAPVTRPAASFGEPTVNTETLEYLSPLLVVAKGRLDETPICSFRAWVDRLCEQKYELVKVGEGSFGETYRTKITPNGSTVPVFGKTIFKVIPLRARSGVGSRNFVPVAEAVSEIELLAKMTSIPGFTVYQEAYVVCGCQPPQIITACDAYIHSPNHRPSDRPSVKRYIPTQLWVVIEMQYAGVDLERFRLSSYWQTWDIFWGAAIALARAEVVAKFEHRDLHLGNVCVQATADNETMDGPLQLTKSEAKEVTLGFSGVEVTLIDYTLSRADIAQGHVAFNDLRDGRGICGREGGGGQAATYRRMRAEVFLKDPTGNFADVGAGLASAGAGWKQYRPRTNLLWLHFLLSEIRQLSPEQIEDRPRQQRLPGSDLSEVGSEARAQRLCKSLGDKLTTTFKLLDPETLTRSGLYSAGDLVQYAVKKGWLNEKDLEN